MRAGAGMVCSFLAALPESEKVMRKMVFEALMCYHPEHFTADAARQLRQFAAAAGGVPASFPDGDGTLKTLRDPRARAH